jgi:ABC-type proline/glycine betaine transport system substrate-binding protein
VEKMKNKTTLTLSVLATMLICTACTEGSTNEDATIYVDNNISEDTNNIKDSLSSSAEYNIGTAENLARFGDKLCGFLDLNIDEWKIQSITSDKTYRVYSDNMAISYVQLKNNQAEEQIIYDTKKYGLADIDKTLETYDFESFKDVDCFEYMLTHMGYRILHCGTSTTNNKVARDKIEKAELVQSTQAKVTTKTVTTQEVKERWAYSGNIPEESSRQYNVELYIIRDDKSDREAYVTVIGNSEVNINTVEDIISTFGFDK